MFATRLAGAPAPDYESGYHCGFIERDIQADTLRHYAARLKEFESMTPGRRLFDAGCGAGGFLNFARSLGWSVGGIDGSKAAVQHAKEQYGLNVEVADLNQYDLPRGAYDVIWSFHVVEHLSNPLHLLKTAADGLVSGGILFIGTPLYLGAWIRLHQYLFKIGVVKYPYNFTLPDHISYFNGRTLHAIISSVGLQVVRTWFTARETLAELAAAARRSSGICKAIGNTMLPFEKVIVKVGRYQHINVIAQKKTIK